MEIQPVLVDLSTHSLPFMPFMTILGISFQEKEKFSENILPEVFCEFVIMINSKVIFKSVKGAGDICEGDLQA